MRHITNEVGDCVAWCDACRVQRETARDAKPTPTCDCPCHPEPVEKIGDSPFCPECRFGCVAAPQARADAAEAALRERDAEIERLKALCAGLNVARINACAEVERLTREHEGWESARDGLWSVLRERNAQLERYERLLEQRKRLLWQAQGLLDCRQMPKGCPKNDPCPDCLVAADIEAHLGGEK